MTAAGAPPDGAWQGRRLKGPAAPLGSGRGGHLGRAVLQLLCQRQETAPSGAAAAEPRARGAPRQTHSFVKEIKALKRPPGPRSGRPGGSQDTREWRGQWRRHRGVPRTWRSPPSVGLAGSGREHRRSNSAGHQRAPSTRRACAASRARSGSRGPREGGDRSATSRALPNRRSSPAPPRAVLRFSGTADEILSADNPAKRK